MFTRIFADRTDVPLPRLCVIFKSITFGHVIPDKISKITRDRTHLKPKTQDKPFSVFEIIRMNNQNNFSGFGVIPSSRDKSFYQIKI